MAAAPDRPVAGDVVRRTAYTLTTREANGSYRFTTGVRPKHFQDSHTKEWVPYANDLEPTDAVEAAKGYAYESKGNGYAASFGKRSEVANDRPVLRVAKEGRAVTVTSLGANPSGMSQNRTKIRYSGAYPDVDIELTVDNELVKEDLVFKQAPSNAQAATFRYDINLEGVSATRQEDGSITFKDSTGRAVFRMPKPFMVDSNGSDPERQFSDDIAVQLTTLAAGKVRLELTPDLAWLQDPSRQYPVILDPSVEAVVYSPDGSLAQDTTIYEADIYRKDYNNVDLHVGKNTDPDPKRRDVLIQFPELSNLPQDSIVTSSALKLYGYGGATGAPMQAHRNTPRGTNRR